MRSRLLPALLLAVAACAGQPPPPPAPASPAATPPVPGLRLPRTAAPVRYAATLTLRPSADAFEGAVQIDLTLAEPTAFLWLDGTELTVSDAKVEARGRTIAARAVPGDEDHLGFAFAETVPAGPARLLVRYRGAVTAKDDRGVFREEEEGAHYLFSQFENTEARRAFPCFDDPSFKVPWQLTLRVPEGDVALSNTPAVAEAKGEGAMKEVRFAETQPLPSYLVAFAVGPFDLVDAGKVGQGKVPLRFAVPRGRRDRARWATTVTPELLTRLEAYFGIPYPYEKLDVVAVPQIVSYGAMENAGLITCRAPLMLARPEDETVAFQREYAATLAHEMGHQWFGNLVTMAFWDDIWLNEAFATWLEDKTLGAYKPEWRWDLVRARSTGYAMRGDSLVTARRVRQAIATKDDIQNAFDEITYAKGAAVVGMFEAYLGPEKFRRGVTRYLRDHAHRNATSADFLAALSAEGGGEIASAFSTFLDQPGVPLVRGELRCEGKAGPARIALTQRRYLPAGSPGSAEQTWRIPVCARWDAGRACTLLDRKEGALTLPPEAGCPRWVMLDAGAAGYYHAVLDGPARAALLDQGFRALGPAERMSVIRDLAALSASGDLPIADVLRQIPTLLREPAPEVLEGAIGLVEGIAPATLPPSLQPAFAAYVRRTFGAEARALGWLPRAGEDERRRLLRPTVLTMVADRGDDRGLQAEATALTLRWLDDPRAVPAEVVDGVVAVAASRGDRALWDRLHGELSRTQDDVRRQRLVRALASFRDPALVRASLDLFLKGGLDPRLATDLLYQDESVADVVFELVEKHYDTIVERLPAEIASSLPGMAGAFCDDAHRARVEGFFRDRIGKLTGGPRVLAKALERISLCAARKKAQEASLTGFLSSK